MKLITMGNPSGNRQNKARVVKAPQPGNRVIQDGGMTVCNVQCVYRL
jgi:hypothetical protein